MTDIKILINSPSLERQTYVKETSKNQNNFKDVIDKTIKSDKQQMSKKEENKNIKSNSSSENLDRAEKEINSLEKEVNSVVEKIDGAILEEVDPTVKEDLEGLKNDLISLVGLINHSIGLEESHPEINLENELNGIDQDNSDSVMSLIQLSSSKTLNINEMDITDAKVLVENIINTLGSENIKPLIENLDIDTLNSTLSKLIMDMEVASPEDTLKAVLVKSLANVNESKDKPVLTVTQPIVEEVQIESTKHTFNQSTGDNLSSDDGNSSNENSQEDEFLSKLIGGDKFSQKLENVADRLAVRGADSLDKPKVVTKWTTSEDMIKNVKFMVRNAVSELKVKIYPKELGEMTIKLLSEEGILKADIRATSKETYNLLNANIQDIKKGLEDQGIKIQSVEIGLYSEDTTYFSNQEGFGKENLQDNEGFSSKDSEVSDLNIEEDSNLSTIETNLDYLA